VNALLLKSLPYSHPERMGTIYTRIAGPTASDERHNLNGEQWELLRDNVPALISAVSSRGTSGVNLEWGSQVQDLLAGRTSANYLDVLAIQPVMGRNFSPDEDRPYGPKTAILSYRLWRNTFSSNPNILGQAIQLKGDPCTVVGVLPDGATTPLNADLYTVLQPSREGEGGGTNFESITRVRSGGLRSGEPNPRSVRPQDCGRIAGHRSGTDSCPPRKLPVLRRHFYPFPFFDEEGNADLQAGLQPG
jgi:hypothetical protein